MSKLVGNPLIETDEDTSSAVALESSSVQKALTKLKTKSTKGNLIVFCTICEQEYRHERRDKNGDLTPFALCQHIVYRGMYKK